MKKYAYLLLTLLIPAFVMVGCDDGNTEDGDKQIEISNLSEAVQQGYADDATTGGFTFTAKSSWTATVSEKSRASGVSWLRLLLDGTETYSGDAGTFTLTIEIDANYTGETRSATITVTSGSHSITVTVTQNGQTKGGEVPEKPKLITKIVETASFNSDYYSGGGGTYAPYYYEFKYDEQDRLKEYYVKEKDGTQHFKVTYSYDIQGEIRLTNSWDDTNTVPLNSMGYIASTDISFYKTTYTYNSEGYLQKIIPDESDSSSSPYEFIWSGGNPIMMKKTPEWSDYETPSTFSTELNNKTTIDLNIFFFGLTRSGHLYNSYFSSNFDPEYQCALIGLAGKRAKNYMITKECNLLSSDWNNIICTPSTEPAAGSVVRVRFDMDFYGEGSYTFDSDDYPVTFSHQVKVIKRPYIYNGVREYIDTEGDANYERHLEERHGPGPWFYIKLDAATPVTTYDTYTYTISYNK